MSTSITNRQPGVTIEFTVRLAHGEQRVTKHFVDAYIARRFYVAKFKAGKNPKVVKTIK
jgi:hypothetical protein